VVELHFAHIFAPLLTEVMAEFYNRDIPSEEFIQATQGTFLRDSHSAGTTLNSEGYQDLLTQIKNRADRGENGQKLK
jgi:hypothetical protein